MCAVALLTESPPKSLICIPPTPVTIREFPDRPTPVDRTPNRTHTELSCFRLEAFASAAIKSSTRNKLTHCVTASLLGILDGPEC
jgi:hypothetical protein